MRRRKLRWLLALAGLTVLVAAGALVLLPRPDRLSLENFDRIQLGMTRAEVEALLGPPFDSGTRKYDLLVERQSIPATGIQGLGNDPSVKVVLWHTDQNEIAVAFSQSKVVAAQYAVLARPPEQTVLENFLWRAKRQWARLFH